MRMVSHWHMLPREVVGSLSLEIIQELTEHSPEQTALGDPAIAMGLELGSPEVCSSLQHSVVLMLQG